MISSAPQSEEVQDLLDLLHTQVPLLQVQSQEENRAQALFEAAARRDKRELWRWSVSSGLRVMQGLKLQLSELGTASIGDADDSKELPNALTQIAAMKEAALVLLLDVHPYLSNPVITRTLKEMALKAESRGLQIVLMGHEINLPPELAPYTSTYELPTLGMQRVQQIFQQEGARQRGRSGRDLQGCQQTLQALVRHLMGLPEMSVRRLVRQVFGDGQVTTADLARVIAAKREAMGGAELLVFEAQTPPLEDVAGMGALKNWLALRRLPFLEPASSGLPPPKGMLLLGVQGSGKSLAAKATASAFGVPLFRMDFGALFDKWQGESERKLREALALAQAMQPCVLWMDEIEKGLANTDGPGEGGAAQRMLGTLLTWMAERRESVFLVATANDIEKLPPELVRKGRFDEIFFVDLPTPQTRSAIFDIHLRKHQVQSTSETRDQLVALSEGFSGAEIEAAIVAARYAAHARSASTDASLVQAELLRTKPLSVTRAEAIEALRTWAADRTVSADA